MKLADFFALQTAPRGVYSLVMDGIPIGNCTAKVPDRLQEPRHLLRKEVID